MKNLPIVYVDDDEDSIKLARDIIPSLFPEYNVQLYTGRSEDELVSLVTENKPRLILTDHNMPIGDNGSNGLRKIRSKGINTPAILMSGVIDQARAAANGIDNIYFLEKLYTCDKLEMAMRVALSEYSN